MKDRVSRTDCVHSTRRVYVRMDAKFRREGIYLLGKSCWFEVLDKSWQAWTFPVETFEFELQLREAERLNDRQIQALRLVVQQRLSTKHQREMLYFSDCLSMSREVGRNARLTRLKILGKE